MEERQAGGLGLFLMGRLMDEVRFDFDDQRGNLLTMTKHIRPDERASIFELAGRLDAASTQQALAEVHAAIGQGARFVLLDLARVTFLSSSGMRALLLVRKELLGTPAPSYGCARCSRPCSRSSSSPLPPAVPDPHHPRRGAARVGRGA